MKLYISINGDVDDGQVFYGSEWELNCKDKLPRKFSQDEIKDFKNMMRAAFALLYSEDCEILTEQEMKEREDFYKELGNK